MSVSVTALNPANSPVVALHSSASDRSQWAPLAARLNANFNVIAMELPGYGKSIERAEGVKGIDAVIAPIIEKIESLGEQVHLVGHSFGGAAAIKIAMVRPDLVRSLAIYEPAVFHLLRFGGEEDRALLGEIGIVSAALETAANGGNAEAAMEQLVDYWTKTGSWQRLPADLRGRLVANANAPAADFADIANENWDIDALESLAVPTLVMMGMDSPQAAQRTTAMVARSIPGAEFAMLPDLGHMAPVQSPEWIIPRIHQYIARVEKSAPHVSWPRKSAA